MNDEVFFERAATELKNGTAVPGLMAKTFARTNGDETKAAALYVRWRAQQLRNEYLGQLAKVRAAQPAKPMHPAALIALGIIAFFVLAVLATHWK